MIELDGSVLDCAMIKKFDCENLGNVFITDKETFHEISMLKDENGRVMAGSYYEGNTILGCRVVFVKEKCFMKGVI